MRALPATFVPAGWYVGAMALSPDGGSLAAGIGNDHVVPDSTLNVFDLATGAVRKWSARLCPSLCTESGGDMGFGTVSSDALSWTADGKHLAFLWIDRVTGEPGGAVRLLDTTAPGTDLLADSRRLSGWPGWTNHDDPLWRGALVTPDGQTVIILEEVTAGRVGQRLVQVSVATGKATTIDDLGFGGRFQQVLYTNATGSLLVVTNTTPSGGVGILNGRHYTPIHWDPHTAIAAW
jgi:hypothetical protein